MMRVQCPRETGSVGARAGGDFFEHRQFGAPGSKILCTNGVTIDDRLVVRRRVDVAGDVFGEHHAK